MAGRVVTTANDVQNMLGTLPKGWRIPIAFARDGRRQEILVRLPGVHGEDELLEKMATALPPPPPAPPAPAEVEGTEPADGAAPEESDSEKKEGTSGKDAPSDMKGADGKPIPKSSAKRIVPRKGFANYFYNLQNQSRMFEAIKSTSPTASPVWEIRGKADFAKDADVIIRLSDEGLMLTVGAKVYPISSTADRFDSVDGKAGAAMLPALDNWRRLLVRGNQKFGDVYYLGTAPFLGQRPLRDVLVGTADELETRFISHPDTGRLEAVELSADRSQDPAELILDWSGATAEKPYPKSMEIRYGTEVYLRVTVDSWQVLGPETPAS